MKTIKNFIILFIILLTANLYAITHITQYDIDYINKNIQYDEYFKAYSMKFFNNIKMWKKFKYQCYIESAIINKRKSSAGAVGLMQLLPSTFKDIQYNINVNNINKPDDNIQAGIYYMSWLYKKFDDFTLSLISYNWGIGNLQRIINEVKSTSYEDLYDYLPLETRRYVQKYRTLLKLNNEKEKEIEKKTNKEKDIFYKIIKSKLMQVRNKINEYIELLEIYYRKEKFMNKNSILRVIKII